MARAGDQNSIQSSKQATLVSTNDLYVYILIALGIYGVWGLSETGDFSPSTDRGYWIGVIGAAMMGFLFLYPMRKHFKFARNWGKLKGWFIFHMLLGVGGPLLILLHSNFRIGSLNAGVALYSMLVVMLSGVIGRFLFVRVNLGLAAQSHALERLGSMVGISQMETYQHLESFPQVIELLDEFEKHSLVPQDNRLVTHIYRLISLPKMRSQTLAKSKTMLSQELECRARDYAWTLRETKRLQNKATSRVDAHLSVIMKVGFLLTYRRLLSTWHVAHIPFVYLLILSAVVHIVAVHAY